LRRDATLAKEIIRRFFKFQKENRFLPDVICENGIIGCKPPVFAWAVETVYNRDGDRSFIEEMYPKLAANIGFWEKERSAGGLFFMMLQKRIVASLLHMQSGKPVGTAAYVGTTVFQITGQLI